MTMMMMIMLTVTSLCCCCCCCQSRLVKMESKTSKQFDEHDGEIIYLSIYNY